MRWCIGLVLVTFGCMTLDSVPVTAKPKSTTTYKHYAISGTSARNIYQQMVRRGPHVGGERALASTSVTTQQSGELGGNSSCRVRNYSLNMDFTIRLPKVRNEKALPADVRQRWRAFYKFVRRHEQRHRAIWLGCAAAIERQVRKLSAKSCRRLESRANGVFKKLSASCEKKHDAFDRAEQKRLARHPLVTAANRVPRKTRTATRRITKAKTTVRAFARGRASDDF